MSSNDHPNATLGDFSIDSAMTTTQLHINPVHHQPVFPYDHASPSMSSYPFSPHQATPGVDPYRNSPAGPHTSAQAVNLPPIRSIESHPQQPPQPSQSPSTSVSNPYVTPLQGQNAVPPYGPQMGHMPPYYPHPMGSSYGQPMVGGQMGMNMATSPPGLRYPIPPGDINKTLSGGRHKKEVKRRTKTGCLTCRRRRIKCDEGQPTCRNCQKSKRECLGYDPIFKPQSGPSSIQPALKLAQPESPASSQSYNAPSLVQAQSHSQSHSTATDSPRSSLSQPDVVPPSNSDPNFSTATLPYGVLAEAGVAPSGITSVPTTMQAPTILKTPSAKPFLIPFSKRLRLDELHDIDGLPPQSNYDSAISSQDSERIRVHYLQNYAPHLDRFFEVRFWGTDILCQNDGSGHIMRQYRRFLSRQSDYARSRPPASSSEEAKLIWGLFKLCQSPTMTTNGAQRITSSEEAQRRNTLMQRLRVLEALLTGEYLSANPLNPPDQVTPNTGITTQLKQREFEFWFCIGRIVSTPEIDALSVKQLDDSLTRCRAVLNNFEQRDVIYSIAVARHIGRRWGGVMKPGPGVAEAKEAYDIATDFLRKETVQGTNPVIQRICSMATKIWT